MYWIELIPTAASTPHRSFPATSIAWIKRLHLLYLQNLKWCIETTKYNGDKHDAVNGFDTCPKHLYHTFFGRSKFRKRSLSFIWNAGKSFIVAFPESLYAFSAPLPSVNVEFIFRWNKNRIVFISTVKCQMKIKHVHQWCQNLSWSSIFPRTKLFWCNWKQSIKLFDHRHIFSTLNVNLSLTINLAIVKYDIAMSERACKKLF